MPLYFYQIGVCAASNYGYIWFLIGYRDGNTCDGCCISIVTAMLQAVIGVKCACILREADINIMVS